MIRRSMLVAGGLVAVLAALLPAVAVAAEAEPCCFTNQRFTGMCNVVPQEDETCATILNYLNTPNSTGKGYCGGTDIRGGWTHVQCDAKPTRAGAAPAAPACARPVEPASPSR